MKHNNYYSVAFIALSAVIPFLSLNVATAFSFFLNRTEIFILITSYISTFLKQWKALLICSFTDVKDTTTNIAFPHIMGLWQLPSHEIFYVELNIMSKGDDHLSTAAVVFKWKWEELRFHLKLWKLEQREASLRGEVDMTILPPRGLERNKTRSATVTTQLEMMEKGPVLTWSDFTLQ